MQLESARPNNGMKLTARGASDEARQLIPVLCAHERWSSKMALPTMTAATEDDPAPHRGRPSPDTLASRRPWLAIQLVATNIAALLVVAVEGLSVIAVWNLIPLLLALGSLAITRSSLGSRDVRVAVAVFWARPRSPWPWSSTGVGLRSR